MTDLHYLLLSAFLLILLLGLVSGFLSNRTALSEPLIAIVLGILIGPHVLSLVDLAAIGEPHLLIKYVALFTIALTVLEAALRVPTAWLARNYRMPLLFVTLGMAGMWLVGSGVAALLLGLSFWPALLLGAILTPTDPVLSDSVINSDLAKRRVPVSLRYCISIESGSNDGLALPFVALPLIMLEAHSQPLTHFLQTVLLREVVGAIILGAALGVLGGLGNRLAAEERLEASQSQRLITLAMAGVAASLGELAGFSGVIAAFTAGVVFSSVSTHEVIEAQKEFDASVKRVFELPIFIILGVFMPVGVWLSDPWLYSGFAFLILILRRPPVFALLAPLAPAIKGRTQAAYVAWFGPVGIAAVYYAAVAQERLGDPFYLQVASFVVLFSAALHGVTAEPVARHIKLGESQRTER